MNSKSIILLSGGLDSAVSLFLALKKKHRINLALTFDYGQKSAAQEIKSARHLCRQYKIKHQVINLRWLGKLANNALTNKNKSLPSFSPLSSFPLSSSRAVWIPNRNALFINIAASYAEALKCQYIFTGFNKEEARNFPDNSIAFINAANKALKYSTLSKVKIISFTAGMDKKQIIRQAQALNLDLNKLWSCYEGKRKPCGKCESCLRRLKVIPYS